MMSDCRFLALYKHAYQASQTTSSMSMALINYISFHIKYNSIITSSPGPESYGCRGF